MNEKNETNEENDKNDIEGKNTIRESSENSLQLPMVALRNMAVLPGMLIHFDISRQTSRKAVEYAMKAKQQAFLIAQRDMNVDKPSVEDLYQIGTVVMVKQMIRLPGDVVRVLVFGVRRAKLEGVIASDPYYLSEVSIMPEDIIDLSDVEKEAMMRTMKEILESYAQENSKLSKEIVKQLALTDNLEQLLDSLAIQIPMGLQERQKILEADNIIERYQQIAVIMTDEIEILRIKRELQNKVKEKVDKNQKEYIMREQMKIIQEELGETNTVSDAENFLTQLSSLIASDSVKDKIKKEILRFKNISGNSSESAVARGYIELLLALPWDKTEKETMDIKYAKRILDRDHYGLEKVKERMLEFLAVRSLTEKGESPIICLVGPPGTGKTSIARSVAAAMNKKYIRISLGGVRDEAEIRGHRRTYVGALPGRIASGLKAAGVKNPLMLLDEIDKVSSDYKGDTASALLEVLDSEQNNKFVDHYVEIPIDLSEVLFITTANSTQTIPRPLLDRMELIEVNSYTQNEKVHIASRHLVSKQIHKNGLKENQIKFSEKALEAIITGYTREAGVRNLERRIGEICRKAARELLEDKKIEKISITNKNLEKYLGKIKYTFDKANREDEIGIVRGLAWTSVGGDTLQIEVNTMPGKGNFELTGQLGDVMKESAKAGISYIRSVAGSYDIDPSFFEKNDIHIHIPEGAVPKDGPSAGITMATAMISAITKKTVRADTAMTGEITLRGRVLPIGGLKEKILAAKTAGIKQVILPEKNRRDVEDIAPEILEGIELFYVCSMEDVLQHAFVNPPPRTTQKKIKC